MNNLQVINQDGVFVVDSRDVAAMTSKDHSHLLRDIKGYIEIMDPNPDLDSASFFIPSTYLDKQNQERPNYLCTRKGCDMVANKMTGEKGVLFTAAYVTKFEEMEKQLSHPDKPKPRTTSRVKPAIKDALDAADYLADRLGIKPGIAQAACIRAVEKNSGLDLSEISKCLPPAEHETGFLNATELGKHLKISAVSVNKLLASKGLQEQQVDAKGNKDWRLTENGKQHGEEFPYVRNSHSGYQIKWNESVMGVLGEKGEPESDNAAESGEASNE